MTRREFLAKTLRTSGKLALIAGTSNSASQILLAFAKPEAPNETIKNIIDRVADIINTNYDNAGWWTNGRTAMLIAKT